ncbi:MAG: hypothetical protein EOO55_03350 [Hymenobacter sp.]|nr:MAG: hypothetical protein EOO55_03350 [Hymenobacter sp.]
MTTPLYDLFVKKTITFSDAVAQRTLPTALGAAGLNIPLAAARELRHHVRSQGGVAVVFPSSYRTPQYDYPRAYAIASGAYAVAVAADPANFGPLELYDENPVYWLFSADNYRLQAEGYSPGRQAFPIDKLTGELLHEEALRSKFSSLQESD